MFVGFLRRHEKGVVTRVIKMVHDDERRCSLFSLWQVSRSPPKEEMSAITLDVGTMASLLHGLIYSSEEDVLALIPTHVHQAATGALVTCEEALARYRCTHPA